MTQTVKKHFFIPVAPLEALNSSINFAYKTPPVIMNPTTANWAKKAEAQTSHCRLRSECTILAYAAGVLSFSLNYEYLRA